MESTIISLRAQLEAMTSEKQEMRLQMQNMQEQFQLQVTQLQEQSRQQMEQLQLQNTRLMDKMSELVQKTSCNKKEQKVAKRTRTSNRFEALNVEGEEPLTTSDDQKMAPKKKTKNCPNSEEPEPELEQEEEEENASGMETDEGAGVVSEDESSSESEDEPVEEEEEKPKHSPEFIVSDMSVPNFERAMTAKKIQATVRILPSGKQTVKCAYNNRQIVSEWLKENSAGATTSTSRDDRAGVTLVKGIHADYTPEEVTGFFGELVDFKINSAKRFQETAKDGKRLPWWIISAGSKEDIMELTKIKRFGALNSPIKWEPLRTNKATRCFQCCGHRHIARNCMNPVKCALCAKNHATRDCKLPYPTAETKDYSRYSCVNCAKKGHWAGHHGCPVNTKEDELAAKRAEQQVRKNQPMKTAPTAADFDVTEKQRRGKGPAPVEGHRAGAPSWIKPNGVSQRGVWDIINNETQELFGSSAGDMIRRCEEFGKKLKNLEKTEDKKVACFEFFSKFCNVVI